MAGTKPPLEKASFTYVGPEDEVEVFGVKFPKGVAVEVDNQTHLGAQALKKLPTNQHFRKGA